MNKVKMSRHKFSEKHIGSLFMLHRKRKWKNLDKNIKK